MRLSAPVPGTRPARSFRETGSLAALSMRRMAGTRAMAPDRAEPEAGRDAKRTMPRCA